MILFDLFTTFLKIGAFSFGGGYTMIPFFEKEIALHHWTAAADYPKMIALAQIFPGPFAIDSSAYIGYRVAGLIGALMASIALSLPSFIALILITKFYGQFKTNQYVQMTLSGVRPVIIGLLVSATYIVGFQPFVPSLSKIAWFPLIKALLFMGAGFILLKKTRINPVLFILLFGVIGVIFF